MTLQFGNSNIGGAVFLGVSPNPFASLVDFELMVKDGGDASLDLFDSEGKLVHSSVHTLTAGKQRITLRGDMLPSGRFFFFRLRAAEQVFTGKLTRG